MQEVMRTGHTHGIYFGMKILGSQRGKLRENGSHAQISRTSRSARFVPSVYKRSVDFPLGQLLTYELSYNLSHYSTLSLHSDSLVLLELSCLAQVSPTFPVQDLTASDDAASSPDGAHW